MSSSAVNPYDILQHRRKIKHWKKTTPI